MIRHERTNSVAHPARIAIQGKVGPGEVWTNLAAFTAALNQLDDTYGPAEATDIENLAFWRYSLESFGPIITTAPIVAVTWDAVASPYVGFVGKPGHLYTIKSSTNYVDWDQVIELRNVSTQYYENLSYPMPVQYSFSVQRVEERRDP